MAANLGSGFLLGISVLLVINILQRGIGLVRNVVFCQFLGDAELGQWAMANSFFVLAAPLAVLGLPGSLGKFVEVYRRQGALGSYLRSLTLVSAIGLIGMSILMSLSPAGCAWMIFNDTRDTQHVAWLISTLAAVAIFNYVNELMSAFRQVRIVPAMQFLNSAAFALLGVLGIIWTGTWSILLPSYALASLLASLPGLWILRTQYAGELRGSAPIDNLWGRILPFAVTMWFMQLLTSMFEICDRTMLLHLTPGDAAVGQAIIGQYHCGRIIPVLLTNVAAVVSGILLPYLSAYYEAGQHDQLRRRLPQLLQASAVALTATAGLALLLSPVLFQYMLGGRYAEGQFILPLALLQAVWLSLFVLAQTHLFCLERGSHVNMIVLVGLLLNIGLSYPLISHLGLVGSVAATTVSQGVILALLLWRIGREGYPLGWRTAGICFAPVVLVGLQRLA